MAPAIFGEALWAEARRRHGRHASETVVLGDGAAWIWNLAADKFFTSRQVVDWYHAKLHLTQAANVLHGAGPPAAHRWLREHETPLLQGHAERLANDLRTLAQKLPNGADHLRREAGYFQDNYHRMQYLEMREEGFPIGSGMVESACKQFQARLAGLWYALVAARLRTTPAHPRGYHGAMFRCTVAKSVSSTPKLKCTGRALKHKHPDRLRTIGVLAGMT